MLRLNATNNLSLLKFYTETLPYAAGFFVYEKRSKMAGK